MSKGQSSSEKFSIYGIEMFLYDCFIGTSGCKEQDRLGNSQGE